MGKQSHTRGSSTDKDTDSRTNSCPRVKPKVNSFLEGVKRTMQAMQSQDIEEMRKEQIRLYREKMERIEEQNRQMKEKLKKTKKEKRKEKMGENRKDPTASTSKGQEVERQRQGSQDHQGENGSRSKSVNNIIETEPSNTIKTRKQRNEEAVIQQSPEESIEQIQMDSKQKLQVHPIKNPGKQITCKQQYIDLNYSMIQTDKAEKPTEPTNKSQKTFEEDGLQKQGTYQIGIAHLNLLRIQRRIDENLNFRHQVRGVRSIMLKDLIRYLNNEGFKNFNHSKFALLQRINPFLYRSFIEQKNGEVTLGVYKLTSVEIEERYESTKSRMTRMSIPELLT